MSYMCCVRGVHVVKQSFDFINVFSLEMSLVIENGTFTWTKESETPILQE